MIKLVSILEVLSKKITYFDLHLDNWSKNVEYNLYEYDDVIDELIEKYMTKERDDGSGIIDVNIPPEIKLLLILCISAVQTSSQSIGELDELSSILLKKKQESIDSKLDPQLSDDMILKEIHEETSG